VIDQFNEYRISVPKTTKINYSGIFLSNHIIIVNLSIKKIIEIALNKKLTDIYDANFYDKLTKHDSW